MGTPIAVYAAAELDRHTTPSGHPEHHGRLDASLAGLTEAELDDAIDYYVPRLATASELCLAHTSQHVARIERVCAAGGGALDGDTFVVPGSWDTARRAAGAVLDAIDGLQSGVCDVAFAAGRPPGHHAVLAEPMGFCLFNNVAVGAAQLVAQGNRVAIVDWDVHHGNGTQDIFYDDPNVLYVSLHESPLYPGTGHLHETGGTAAPGTNLNLPFPSGTRGDVYRQAVDDVVIPIVERFAPDWLFISAGFDAHRQDPLAGLELTSADYADLAVRLQSLVPARRTVVVLEGGYDLEALAYSTGATLSSLVGGTYRPEPASTGEIGLPTIVAARQRWDLS